MGEKEGAGAAAALPESEPLSVPGHSPREGPGRGGRGRDFRSGFDHVPPRRSRRGETCLTGMPLPQKQELDTGSPGRHWGPLNSPRTWRSPHFRPEPGVTQKVGVQLRSALLRSPASSPHGTEPRCAGNLVALPVGHSANPSCPAQHGPQSSPASGLRSRCLSAL